MVQRAVIVPDAPALVPALGGAGSASLDEVREACLRAVAAGTGGTWCAVGTAPGRATRPLAGPGTALHGYGRNRTVRGDLAADPGAPVSPARAVAGWLADRCGLEHLPLELLDPGTDPSQCARIGRRLTADNLLVLGSGTFTWEPGDGTEHFEHPIDLLVAKALADGDPDGLRRLDPATCRQTNAQGRGPWQVLAGAAAGHTIRADLLYSNAPFGVRYHVATWQFS